MFLDGEDIIGNGTINFNVNFVDGEPNSIIVWLEVSDWDIGSRFGPKYITTSYQTSEIYGLSLGSSIPRAGTTLLNTPAEWCDDYSLYMGKKHTTGYFTSVYANQLGRSNYYWTNVVDIDEIPSVTRIIDGIAYPSHIKVSDNYIIYYNGTASDDITISAVKGPYTLQISDPAGLINETYTWGGALSNTATVTVYVQNSQTGALLANARLTIQDTTTDPWTEVVNQTLTSGTGTFSLPKDTGLHLTQYRIGATVPGYQQVVPALFARVTGPTNIVVEMEPTAGGPEDPNNAYLEFYVRDIHANGIPNANVLVDGKTRWTNGQGYTQFEVAKNATYPYTVSKSGYMTIQGSAIVADGPRYVANVVLGPGTVPTYTPTLGPGETPGGPGATPTPDTRTNEQKGQAIIDLIADFAEPIAILAILATIFGLMKMMTPGRR
jgi:hypothetical protein